MTLTPIPELAPPQMLIAGAATTASGQSFTHRYAASGQVTNTFPLAGTDEIAAATQAAESALPEWTRMGPNGRRDVLSRIALLIEQHGDELTAMSVVDTGMPVAVARASIARCADHFRYASGWADKLSGQTIPTWPQDAHAYTTVEPYGVVAIIIPWNSPLGSAAMTMAPALAAGNTLVIKPPEVAPYSVCHLGEIITLAGGPEGLVNVCVSGPEGGDALVRDPRVGKVHFTGSGATARFVIDAARDNLVPVALELGGKSAHLVFEDVPDLDAAVRHALSAVWSLSGQKCTAGTRVLVQRPVYREALERIAAACAQIRVGDPFDETTQMGPVITEAASKRILDVVMRARESSAGTLLAGGSRLNGDLASGWFITPTLFADVDPSSELWREEVFGPVLSIAPFDTESEAVQLANNSRYGLGAWVQTADAARIMRVARALDVGNVWVNGGSGSRTMLPFGGNKHSGYGRLGGLPGVMEFARPKSVWLEYPEAAPDAQVD